MDSHSTKEKKTTAILAAAMLAAGLLIGYSLTPPKIITETQRIVVTVTPVTKAATVVV